MTDFARACKAAARAVVLYPTGHPAIDATLSRLAALCSVGEQPAPLVITVLPDGLLLNGRAPARPDRTLGELAATLHLHLIGQLTVNPGGSVEDWRRFLLLVGRPADEVRSEGGVAALWAALDGRHVEVAELDYARVLGDGEGDGTGTWNDIVSQCLRDDGGGLDEAGRKALFEATGDPAKLGDLFAALETRAVANGRDEEAQATALVGLLDHIVTSVTEHDPGRIDDALTAAAEALSQISPDLMASLLAQPRDTSETPGLIDTVVSHMSEATIAHYVAQHALVGGTPMDRLAQAFQVLVPEDRRDRVLSMARADAASSGALDQSGFEALWGGIAQKLLMSYSDKPFVSEQYGRELSRARTTALDVEKVGDDPPERIEAWLVTLTASELRRLDHLLMRDLLRLETDAERWATLMHPAIALVYDQLLVADFEAAAEIVEALVAERRGTVHRAAATRALEGLAAGPIVRHVTEHVAALDERQFEQLCGWLPAIGNGLTKAIADELTQGTDDVTRDRLTRLLFAFGSVGRLEIERLRQSPSAAGRRAAILLLQHFGGHDQLAELTALLDDPDWHVLRDTIGALLDVGTERARGTLSHALAHGSVGARRAILGAAEARDGRAAPVFAHVLDTVGHRGPHAELYLKSVQVLGTFQDPVGIEPLTRALARGEWWAPRRTAMLRHAAAAALARIGTPPALDALAHAARTGPRGVRAAARAALGQAGPAARRGDHP